MTKKPPTDDEINAMREATIEAMKKQGLDDQGVQSIKIIEAGLIEEIADLLRQADDEGGDKAAAMTMAMIHVVGSCIGAFSARYAGDEDDTNRLIQQQALISMFTSHFGSALREGLNYSSDDKEHMN